MGATASTIQHQRWRWQANCYTLTTASTLGSINQAVIATVKRQRGHANDC
jgi:hypothetical protein